MNTEQISFEEAKYILDTQPGAMLLDVREEAEYITGHPDGAELLTLADIDADSAAYLIPDYDTPLLVYCRSGVRSREAVIKLRALGYRKVYNLGSMVGWPYSNF